jgi:hypothetical protein
MACVGVVYVGSGQECRWWCCVVNAMFGADNDATRCSPKGGAVYA